MKRFCMLLALFVALSASGVAFADTFSFSFTAPDFSGSGLFQTTPTAKVGQLLVSGITGMVNTGSGAPKTITGILPAAPSPNSFQSNDNILFYPAKANGNFFDQFGVSFLLSNGAEVNLFDSSGFLMRSGGNTVNEKAAITVNVAPEPSSLVLLGTGLLGAFATARRKFAKV